MSISQRSQNSGSLNSRQHIAEKSGGDVISGWNAKSERQIEEFPVRIFVTTQSSTQRNQVSVDMSMSFHLTFTHFTAGHV
jgi:hypothetical protein